MTAIKCSSSKHLTDNLYQRWWIWTSLALQIFPFCWIRGELIPCVVVIVHHLIDCCGKPPASQLMWYQLMQTQRRTTAKVFPLWLTHLLTPPDKNSQARESCYLKAFAHSTFIPSSCPSKCDKPIFRNNSIKSNKRLNRLLTLLWQHLPEVPEGNRGVAGTLNQRKIPLWNAKEEEKQRCGELPSKKRKMRTQLQKGRKR